MSRILNKRTAPGDDILGWIGIGLALVAAIILDKGSAPHKWHAAIMWTFGSLFSLLLFGRKKRGSWLFWIFWVGSLVLHGFAMWLIFARLLPHLILGTLYVIPIALAEAIFLLGIFTKLEHKLLRGGLGHPSNDPN
jgi:hypothetical protein